MNPLLRLLGAAASHGLLTGQIVFSAAFVGACEPPNWIHAPRQVNACLERWMTVSASPGSARDVPMSRPIPAGDDFEHFDPELPHHRAWLLAVLELVAHEPRALEEGGTLRRLWSKRQETAASASPSQSPSPPAGAASNGNPLSVPRFAQLDSATDQARRMCFSSSCAMLLAHLKPGVLIGSNGDDQYLARVRPFGDTSDAAAQISALASYGIKARFTNQASFSSLEQQIVVGIPVPCGYLHRGHVSTPAGGGHWLIVVGITPTHVIVHDPLGEADLVNGTTIAGTARFCRYSRANFGRRWMAEG